MLHYFNFSNAGHALASLESGQNEVPSSSRELISLAQKWSITENGVVFQGLNFEMSYITSDFIQDNMATAVAYTLDCKEGGIIIPEDDLNVTIALDNTPPGAGYTERDFAVKIRANPSNLETSSIYSVVEDENGNLQARVEFCMRFSLFTQSTLIEANFLETIVKFKADLSSGFSIEDANVEPKKLLVSTVFKEFEVDAYQCDQNNVPLSAAALMTSTRQGEAIRVCVTPTQDAQDEGILMRGIRDFSYYRDYGGQIGIVTQVAIEYSQAASNFLTTLDCTPGDLVCSFDTILFASMFISPGFVEGSGTAELQIGSGSGRKRRLNAESRSSYRLLQGASGDSQFDLEMELQPGEPFNGKLRTSSSSKTKSVASFVAMGTIAILNLLI